MKKLLVRLVEAMEELVSVVKGHLPPILAALDSIEEKIDRLNCRK